MTDFNSFSVHTLGSQDISIMKEITEIFAIAFDDKETYSGAKPSEKYLSNLLHSDYFIALAALKGDKVIGGIAAYELQKFEQERSEIYIYDLAVDEKHRRGGIATALILELKKLAALRSAYVVFVQADYGDDPAIELYSKFGTPEDVLHFDIPTQGIGEQEDAKHS